MMRSARTSAPACSPKLMTRPAAEARAWARTRSKEALSRLSTAVPPGSMPQKISPLASAMAEIERKNSICTGSTVVITATCGRTMRVSGSISPAWFMPISKTP